MFAPSREITSGFEYSPPRMVSPLGRSKRKWEGARVGVASGDESAHQKPLAASAPTSTLRTKTIGFGVEDAAGDSVSSGFDAIQRSSSARSRAVCQRASGSLARHLSMTRRSVGGLSSLSPDVAFGPTSISRRTSPNAKRSVRASAFAPSSCSGAIYRGVPMMARSPVRSFCNVGA